MHLRLAGIDAAEKNTTGAEKATNALKPQTDDMDVYVCSIKAKRSDDETKDGFGRYFAVIHHKGWNINEWLLKSGLVCEYVEGQDCNPYCLCGA
ncbi:MAG: thermonuclease family protein [Pseudomonadota bacterium]